MIDLYKKILSGVCAAVISAVPGYGLIVTIEGTSTSSQLDLTVTGEVQATDFADGGEADRIFFYASGVEWADGSISNFVRNEEDGPNNTAPSIVDASYLLGGSADVSTGSEDAIIIRNLDPDIAVGDIFEWTFSVRNFGLTSYDFTPLLGLDTLSSQIGTGSLTAVPEPSTWALLLGAAGFGLVVWRRRRNA